MSYRSAAQRSRGTVLFADLLSFRRLALRRLPDLFPPRSGAVSLARRFNANDIKLSIDALEILDVAQSHRVRTFFTRILPPRFMARRRLQKEPAQFISDCFQILARVGQ